MYTVGVSREFLNQDGTFMWGDIGLGAIEREPRMQWKLVPSLGQGDDPAPFADCDALLVLRQWITDPMLEALPRLRHVSRWGAGLDRIDLDACSRHGVLVTSTPQGGKRPVAAAALTLVLALTHRLVAKDRLVRENRWGERAQHMGIGLTGKVVGIIGLGQIGREFARLLAPFDSRLVAYSPHAAPEDARDANVALVGLDELLQSADVVVVTCALSDATRGLLSAQKIGLMRPTAYLVNVARGEIIDEAALTDALAKERIAGAGLDVFHQEPLPADHPFIQLDNVLLTPHALAWTDEIISGNAVDAIGSLIQVMHDQRPRFMTNPDVIAHARWSALKES